MDLDWKSNSSSMTISIYSDALSIKISSHNLNSSLFFVFMIIHLGITQSAIDQQTYIGQDTVFFFTTVGETSLTFSCLKYVIDSGTTNMPKYNLKLERTELEETKPSKSTIKQRLGRLGRTQPGEYYALHDYKPSMLRKVNFEFSIPTRNIFKENNENILYRKYLNQN